MAEAKKHFDDAALRAVLSPAPAPATFDREGRVKLLGEAGRALLAGEMPNRQAAILLGGAVMAWLNNGGDLARDHLQVIVNGSHFTPHRIWEKLKQENRPLKGTTDTESATTLEPSLEPSLDEGLEK